MDILFITPVDKPGLSQEVNGTMLLATKLLQAGYSVDIIRFYQISSFNKDYYAFLNDITAEIISRSPRCVSFYTLWPSFHIVLRIAQFVKNAAPHIPVILGGPLVSLYPVAILEGIPWIDFVCTGEGESTIVPFIHSLLDKLPYENIPGLYYRDGDAIIQNNTQVTLCNLNDLPHWDQRLLASDPRNEPNISSATYYMPIDVGRGCPYSCTFCCTSNFWRRTYRLKSPEKIFDEIKYYHNNFGIRSFLFSHDAFTANKRLVSNVCEQIIDSDLNITWNCATRADCVTEDLIQKMKAAGLRSIQLGVETGSAKMQRQINKNLNLDSTVNIVRFLLANKISVTLFFMYGFPTETEEDIQDTLNMVFSFIDMGVKHITMSFCNFSPATQITMDNYDNLIFDPKIAVSPRCSFGYNEEIELIKEHKPLFPFFYHMHTSVRDQYFFLNCLVEVYQTIPKAACIVRKLYKGDDLRFYCDFERNNRQCFQHHMDYAMSYVQRNPFETMFNTIADMEHPRINQINALLQFIRDVYQISKSPEDYQLKRMYDFCYLDYRMNRDFDDYLVGKTEILIKKSNGKTSIRIMDMQ